MGYNPYKTAGNVAPFLKQISDEFKMAMARPFADAVRMARTSQLWTYREASRANYQANSDVISGWTWFASLDNLVCPACLSMHGTVHPLDEPLDGHPHCRCTPIPIVLNNPFVEEGAGLAWYQKQPEEVQQAILGKGAYNAGVEGKFQFSDLPKRVEDDVYGSFTVVKPLKELVPNDNP